MCSGNDNLHLLTSDTRQRLCVDLADFRGNTRYAEFDNFTVDSAETKYQLVSLGTYSGTAGQYDIVLCCVYEMTLSCYQSISQDLNEVISQLGLHQHIVII